MTQDAKELCPQLWEECQSLKALVSLGQALADPGLELDQKLQAAVELLSAQAGAERASLMLVQGSVLVVRAATNPKIIGLETKLSEQSISTQVVSSGQPVFTKEVASSDYASVSRHGDVSSYRTGSLISLPLTVDHKVEGVLNLSDKAGQQHFSSDDLALAQGIASQVSRLVHFSALHEDLNQAYQELSRTQQAKEDLMHMIFHDMKAPVTGVKEVLKLLGSDLELSEEERAQYMAVADGDLELLWRRISNLLDLNRMDADAFPTDPISLELEGLVREAVARLSAVSRVREVEVGVSATAEPTVLADEDLTERIVVNLLFNALKFSTPEEGGGGKVDVGLGIKGGQAVLTITDTGPGVDEALGQAVFERYTTSGVGKGSSGLGLYFCRRASRLMGGEVAYENLAGGGAKFSLRLPLEQQD